MNFFSIKILWVSEECVKLLSRVWLFAIPWTVAYKAPLSMEFSRQEYWSGVPFPSPGDLPDPGIEPGSPALQAEALASEAPGKLPLRYSRCVFIARGHLTDIIGAWESSHTCACKSLHLCPALCNTVDCSPLMGLLCPEDSPDKITGAGCHAFLQGIFPTQRSNPHLFCLPALAGRFFTTNAT